MKVVKIAEINLKDISLQTLTKMWEEANKEPEPPEPEKHGDSGFDNYGLPSMSMKLTTKSELKDTSTTCVHDNCGFGRSHLGHVKTKIFNAFTDLAAIKAAMEAGDVKDFKFKPNSRNVINVFHNHCGEPVISTKESGHGSAVLTLPQLKQFIIKLRALATKKEQENGGC